MKKKKWMAVCLVAALLLAVWSPVTVRAVEEKKTEYYGEGYLATMQVTSEWADGFNAEVKIENIGTTVIDNWAFAFAMPYDIVNIWNGVIVCKETGAYVVKNAGSNQDIEVGASVSFGFTAVKEGEISLPITFKLLTKKELVSADSYEIKLNVVNDWQSAFQGEIKITNYSDKEIEDWELAFGANFEITAFYTADILSKENGRYVVKNKGYNANIQAGETLSLGFSATPGNVSTELKNIELYQIVTEDYAGNEEIDKEKDTDGDSLPDYIEEILGTSCTEEDTDRDGLNDMVEVYYGSEPLVDESNMDFDDDGLTTAEELEYETHFYLADTDEDDLNDYEEIKIYQTNPNAEDTDGDGMDDGTEVRMGFDPLSVDSDGDGVPDGQEKVQQSVSAKFAGDEKNAIISVEVSMEATGELGRTTTIENMYGNDVLASGVVGLVGMPVEITTISEFEEATITFSYEEALLGEAKEEDLRVMWYDEANNQFVLLDEETILNTENNTVSYTTTHFSTYMVVDRQAWYDVWSDAVSYGRKPGTSAKPEYFDICYVIDKSGSMSGTRIATAKEAIGHFIEAMYSEDRGAIIGFSNSATVYQNFTSDKTALFEALNVVYASGGTSVESGLKKALDIFPSSSEQLENGIFNSRMILLLCDGSVDCTQSTLERAKNMGVKIYPILIGTTRGKDALQTIADETGGVFYCAVTAEEIREAIFGVQEDTVGDIDTTDTDGDGLYDVYEIGGMILPNGTYVYTDPRDPDTDDDGKSDGEEMGVLENMSSIKHMQLAMSGYEGIIYADYFDYESDPTKIDTDGDLDADMNDPDPLNYRLNDLLCHNLEKVQELAAEYKKDKEFKSNEFTSDVENWLTFMFVRKFNSGYTSGKWASTGKGIDEGFVAYVAENDIELYSYFADNATYNANARGEKGDLYHMAATVTGYIYKSGYDDGLVFGAMPEIHVNRLSGWAGDLQTAIMDATVITKDSSDYNEFKSAMLNLIGYDESVTDIYAGKSHTFDIDDVYADIDAHNISKRLREETLEEVLSDYYTIGYLNRYSEFIDGLSEEKLKETIYTYTKDKYAVVRWPLFDKKVESNQSEAARDAFAEFLLERAKDEEK